MAVFPARHPEVGGAVLWLESDPSQGSDVRVQIGRILHDHFHDYDTHLEPAERAAFLEKLFADQLLFWIRDDETGGGWRECEEARMAEPLVADNRVYRTFAWSGPLQTWQAVPHILSRNRIRAERDHHILLVALALVALAQSGPQQVGPQDRTQAAQPGSHKGDSVNRDSQQGLHRACRPAEGRSARGARHC